MAGEGDAERLVVLLEARIRDFEKNMQKAGGTGQHLQPTPGRLVAGNAEHGAGFPAFHLPHQ